VRRADNLTTFMCRLSRNLGASTSWNPQGLSRPVMGLLYLYNITLNTPTCFDPQGIIIREGPKATVHKAKLAQYCLFLSQVR
jgi:hypothetical protein